MTVTAVSPKLTLVHICKDRDPVTGGTAPGEEDTASPQSLGFAEIGLRVQSREELQQQGKGKDPHGGGGRNWPRKPPTHLSGVPCHPEPRRKVPKPKRLPAAL